MLHLGDDLKVLGLCWAGLDKVYGPCRQSFSGGPKSLHLDHQKHRHQELMMKICGSCPFAGMPLYGKVYQYV